MRTDNLPQSDNIEDRRGRPGHVAGQFSLSGAGLGLARLLNAVIGRRKARWQDKVDAAAAESSPAELTNKFGDTHKSG